MNPNFKETYITPKVEATAFGSNFISWKYRRGIILSGLAATYASGYQYSLSVDTRTHTRSDCGDLRFSDSDGNTQLSYWVESGCGTNNTSVWVKVPMTGGAGSKTIYMYYGNDSATTTGSVDSVFVTNIPDLVSGYHFDAGSGTSAADESGNGHNYTLYNTPTWLAHSGYGSSLSFAASSSEYMASTAYAIPSTNNKMTFVSWLKIPITSGNKNFFNDASQASSSGYLQAYRDGGTGNTRMVWQYSYSGGTGLNDTQCDSFFSGCNDVWCHAAVVADYTSNKTVTFYRNGALVSGCTITAAHTMLFPSASRAKYTGGIGAGSYGDLAVDEMMVFSNALNATQIGYLASTSYRTYFSSFNTSHAMVRSYDTNEPLAQLSPGSEESNSSITDHFNIAGFSTATIAVGQTVTITAKSLAGDTNISYTGAHNVTFSGAANSPWGVVPYCSNNAGGNTNFGTATALNFTNGVATCTMVLASASAATVTASIDGYTPSFTASTVYPNGVTNVYFDATPGTQTSGTAFYVSVHAYDGWGNNTTNTNTTFNFSTNAGTLSPTSATGYGGWGGYLTLSNLYVNTSVTLSINSSGATGSSTAAFTVIGVDQMDHYNVSGQTGSMTAAGSQTVTVTAVGKSGNAISVTGNRTLYFSGASTSGWSQVPTCAGVGFGSATTLYFSGATTTCTMVLYMAQSATISVSDGTYGTWGTLGVTVSPGSVAAIQVYPPTPVTSGQAFSATLHAVDNCGNTLTNANPVFALTSSAGSISPSSVTVTGGYLVTNLTISNVYVTNSSVTIGSSTSGASATSSAFTVNGVDVMDHFDVVGTASMTAGGSQTATVRAVGKSNNLISSYSGAHYIYFSGASNGPWGTVPQCAGVNFGSATSLTFSGGTASCTLQLFKSETSHVAASDGTFGTWTSLAVVVSPAGVALVDGYPGTTTPTSGTAFSATVYTVDGYGNITTNASPTVSLGVNAGVVSPTLITATNGTFSGNLTISNIYVTTNVSLTWSINSGGNTQTDAISVTGVDVMDHFVTIASSYSVTAGGGPTLTVTAVGKSGNTFSGYNGSHAITFSGPGNSPRGNPPGCGGNGFSNHNVTFSSGVYSCALTLYNADTVGVTATDGTYSATTPSITVAPKVVNNYVFNSGTYTSTSGGAFGVIITARDMFYNTTTNASPSVTLSVDQGGTVTTPVTATNGVYNNNITISSIYINRTVTLTASGAAVDGTATVTITGVDVMDHFITTASSYSVTAGGSSGPTLTVTAVGKSGNTYAGYSGSKNLTLSGPGSSPGGTAPTCAGSGFASHGVTFTSGAYSCALALYKAETVAVTATDGTYSDATDSGIAVAPAAVASLAFNSGTYSSTSGSSFAVTITTKDAYGNTTNNVSPTVGLSASSGSLSPTSVTATNGVYSGSPTISNIYVTNAVTLTASTSGASNTTATVTVTGVDQMDHFTTTTSSTSVTAGGSATLTVTAIGKSGSTYAGYSGSKNLTLSGPGSSPGGTAPTCAGTALGARAISFTSGVYSCSMLLYKAETVAVTATEGTYTDSTPSITVAPAIISSLDLSAPGTAISETQFSVTVTAKDAYGNVTTNVSNAVVMSVNSGSIGPISYDVANFTDDGIHTGYITISQVYTNASVTLTASTNSGNITDTATISVTGVDAVDHFTATSNNYSPTAGGSSTLTVTAIGKSGGTYANYTGSHNITLSGPTNSSGGNAPTCGAAALGSRSATFSSGAYSCALILYNAQTVAVTASDGTYSANTPSITVAPAVVNNLSFGSGSYTSISGSDFAVTILSKDQYGNTTTNASPSVALAVDHSGTVTTPVTAQNGTFSGNININNIYATSSVTLTASTDSGAIIKTVTVTVTGVDVMDHFTLSGTASKVAGESQVVTITAIGKSGAMFAGYNTSHTLVFSGASASPNSTNPTCAGTAFGSNTSLLFSNGSATCSMVLYKTESPAIINVSEGSYDADGNTLSVMVSPATVSSLNFNSGSYSATSETPFSVTIIAKDAYGNTTTNASPPVALSVDHSGIVTTSVTATNGTYSGNITISNIYTDTSGVTLTASTNGATNATATITVTGLDHMDHFTVSGSSPQTAGTARDITINAIGKSGNIYGYSGNHTLVFSGASSIGAYSPKCRDRSGTDVAFGAGTSLSFSSGSASCSLTLYKVATPALINVSEGAYNADSHTLSVTVLAADVSSLDLSAAASATSEAPFSITITTKDLYGNVTPYVNDDVALSVDHGASVSPTSIAAASFFGGVYSGDITVGNIYSHTNGVILTASTNSGTITKTASIDFSGVDHMDHFTISGSGSHIAGAAKDITVTAIGKSGSAYDYTGDHSLTFSGANSSGGYDPKCTDKSDTAIALGVGTLLSFTGSTANCALTLYKSETAHITATEGSYSTSGNLSVDVSPASVNNLSFNSASYPATSETPFSVTLTAKDAYGNVTTNASPSVAFSVDHSAGVSPTPVTATNGTYTGNVTISNVYVNGSVTIAASTGGASDATASVTITGVDQMDHFLISGSGQQIAGVAKDITVTAIGKSGNTYAYSGNHTLTFLGANSIGSYSPKCAGTAFGAGTALSFSAGTASCALVLYAVQTAHVTAAENSYGTSGNLSVDVSPSNVSSLSFDSATYAATSETPFSVTFTTQDIYGNVTPDVSQAVALSVDHGASVGPVSLASSNFTDDGTYTVDVTISQIYVDADVTLTASTNSETITTTATVAMSGVDHMDHFTLTGSSVHTAGVAKPLTVTAIGKSGSKYAQYAGNHTLTFSGVSASPLGHNPSCAGTAFGTATSLSFTSGTATCSLVLYKAEPASVINVSENAYNADSHTLSVNVSPSSFSSLSITAPSSVYKDVSFNVEVVGKDTYGNALPSVSSPTSVSVSSGTVVPATLTSVPYSGSFSIYSAPNGSNTLTFHNGSVTQEYDFNVGDKLTDYTSNTLIHVTQVVTSEITISSPANVIMMPAIAGMTGGTANGGATWTVKTNNAAGFIMKIKASTAPALTSAGGSFADYTQTLDGTPDFVWGVDTDASEFGYTVEPSIIEDTYTTFKDNGSTCNTGFLNTIDKCWAAFNTDDATILSRFSSTDAQGEDVAVKLRAQSGPGHYQISGDYQATITVTALAN